MLRKLLLFLVLLFLLPSSALAKYDPLSVSNNRFGIHILEPQEIEKAAEFVNSSGGDWGYVTIPIRANDRDLLKWTRFMEEAKKLHVIPILRIASFPVDDRWMAPNEYDLIDFANFLGDLPWPIQNRYIVVYNEPNHKNEWGGFVYPEEYARVLSRAVDIFHQKHPDFFVISAGLDSAAPNGTNSTNEYDYLRVMNATIPGLFSKIDGFSTHSYGNPGFLTAPNIYSRTNIANYRFEQNLLSSFGALQPKLFISEAGWRNDLLGDSQAYNFYFQAFTRDWSDENIVAITPFLLSAQTGPFEGFSFTDKNGNFKAFAQELIKLPKIAGNPLQSDNFVTISSSLESFETERQPDTPISLSDLLAKILKWLHL